MRKKPKNSPLPAEAPDRGLTLGTWAGLGLAAIVAAVVAYAPVLKAPFVFDDLSGIFLYPNAADIPISKWLGITRPLTNFTFWLNYQAGATDPSGYHWINLALHLVSAALVTLIVRRLLVMNGTAAKTGDMLAAFSGFIFLLHPLQTEAVSYVSSRSEVLAVCLLWAALGHFFYRNEKAASWYDAIVIFSLFVLACLSKEYSVVFPALLVLADYYWGNIRANWRIYSVLALAAVAGSVLVLKILTRADTVGFQLKDLSVSTYLLTECRVIWVYVLKFVIPFSQTIDYDFLVSHSLTEGGAIFGLAALIATTAAAIVYRKQYPLASYGWLAFLILLAPTSSFLPIRDVIAERRVYLPSLALLLIAVEFLRRMKWTPATTAVLVLPVLVLGFLTSERNTVWSSPELLWRDAVAKAPNKSRPHFQLARVLYDIGSFDMASAEYESAAGTSGGGPDASLLLNWGLALDDGGKPKEALDKFNQAAQVQPTAHVYSQIARAYGRSNQNEKALEALAKAEQLDPNFEMAYVYRGNVYLNQGDPVKATAEYNRALAINPRNGPAQEGLRIASQNRR